MCASDVYEQTLRRECLFVRISLVLQDSNFFAEMRTEKAGLSGEINHTLDAYRGAEAVKKEEER